MVARRTALPGLAASAVLGLGLATPGLPAGAVADHAAAPVAAAEPAPEKQPVAVGWGGAVSTVDADATRIGIDTLRRGGNAVDAAVAAAAALGVTEPYSSGLGGGGFFVYYRAGNHRVYTLDGRETAPAEMRADAFVDPATGKPLPFAEAVESGLSVGVPGTPATWAEALDRWGRMSLGEVLKEPAELADEGFVVDATFRQQTADNEARFRDIT